MFPGATVFPEGLAIGSTFDMDEQDSPGGARFQRNS
jgi:hypothetical protein